MDKSHVGIDRRRGGILEGIMSRYEKAAVDPPKALYVDRDCYGPATVQKYFENWPDIKMRKTQ